ncbi:alpha-amylase family glycosyl hydrolase [Novosphingobium sp. KCTC 2891]|uniref:alpha-amylase family glycosyl hydrolase n=1 Tax=Novosphingobium sp. KCTC 2891 TaxID=2989730 RepID=UPI002222482E|nr:alpha-amylase family glycosyl hydrolase [Novosphingobium sp. KCTC 2891]MCW1384383.1 alpha-amylase family glycosyl hydrolase [Novosphingobium sp. KCTC 2891]
MKSLGTALAAAMVCLAPAHATPVLPVTEGVSQVVHPAWSKSANIYEVNIRQYTPEGTFRAFEKHLPRLRKMGVDVLWIMPINPISKKERKGSLGSYYAVSDYKAINPEYGDLADFRHLVDAAHRQGFKVIVDWVANHTGWDHVWVEQHPDWYKRNAKGELEGYHYTDLSDHHEETWADVIGLDYGKPEVREGMIDAMGYWLKAADIDGFRCDVAWTLPVAFWDEARTKLDRIKPVFMLAEADTPEMQVHAFDMTYDWKLYHLLIDVARGKAGAADLARLYTDPPRRYPAGAYRMTFTSNHDENSWNGTDRELYGDGADAMAVLAATLPGMPLVYSGQEDGLNKRLKFFDKDTIAWGRFGRAAFYRSLLKLKHHHPALASGMEPGNMELVDAGNPGVFAFRRVKGGDRVTVAVNLTAKPAAVTLPGRKAKTLAGWGWTIAAGR